jgi:hypothetical protein
MLELFIDVADEDNAADGERRSRGMQLVARCTTSRDGRSLGEYLKWRHMLNCDIAYDNQSNHGPGARTGVDVDTIRRL